MSEKFKLMRRKALIFLGVLVMIPWGIRFLIEWREEFPTEGKWVRIELSRGSFSVLKFASKKPETFAVMLFASGDGGWNSFEEEICRSFQADGYDVFGIDCSLYATTDYDLGVLQTDFTKLAEFAEGSLGGRTVPLIVAGYSMGAAQAVAVGGGPHPPPDLAGLLLISPFSRGRYGLRTSDRMNIIPTGPGTFAVDSFPRRMDSLRIVQWHAEADGSDSSTWLSTLRAPHRLLTFPHTGHEYDSQREEFLRELVASARWIWAPAQNGKVISSLEAHP